MQYRSGFTYEILLSANQRIVAWRSAGGACSAPVPMTKDADGYWNMTLAPVVMSFHYY